MAELYNVKFKNGDTWETIIPYPVNSIVLMDIADDSPANYYGGTWVRLTTDGLIRLGTGNEANKSGGQWNHQHIIPFGFDAQKDTSNPTKIFCLMDNNAEFPYYGSTVFPNRYQNSFDGSIDAGVISYARVAYTSEQLGSNIPQYRILVAWKRTA